MTKEQLEHLKEEVLKLKNIRDITEILPNMSAYEWLYECNKNRLDSIAINYLGNKITFAQFFQMIDISARAYDALGVKKGDYVSMSSLSIPSGIISFYALNKLGAAVHMVNPASSKKEIIEYMNQVDSKLYITMDLFYSDEMKKAIDKTSTKTIVVTSLMDSLPMGFNLDKVKYKIITQLKKLGSAVNKDTRCISFDNLLNLGSTIDKDIDSVYEENKDAAIAYTSGSTGVSKAVVATDKQMNAMPVQMGMTESTFLPNDIIFNSLPLWIYYSLVNNIHDPLCLGVTVAIDPLFESKKVSKRLKQYRFNHWNTIPAYVEDMCNDKKIRTLDLSYLKTITTGGDYLTTILQSKASELVGIEVGQGYGASELLGSFSYTYEKNSTPGSVGKPLIGNTFKIVDVDTGKTLGVNQTGELYLYSSTMMKCYYKNEAATAEVLVRDDNNDLWYRTGDLAHYNDKGEIFIDGRIRRIVMTLDSDGNPTKIIPDKIKKELLTNNDVEKCEVITIPSSKNINTAIAFVVLKEGVLLTNEIKNMIKKYCALRVPTYMIPTAFHFVDNIPLKPSLKPDWEKLEQMHYDYEQNKTNKQKVFER